MSIRLLPDSFGPSRLRGRTEWQVFTFKLEHEDGTPADPPVLHTAVPTWSVGDTIPLDASRAFGVVEIRDAVEADAEPVLVVKQT